MTIQELVKKGDRKRIETLRGGRGGRSGNSEGSSKGDEEMMGINYIFFGLFEELPV